MKERASGQGKSRKGIFFTLAIILLLIPLIMLVSFYVMTSETKIEDETSKMRCDELHYFVEDVKKDLGRAVVIFGRRAAIYSIDYVVKAPGTPLQNYSFNCSASCNVNCGRLVYPTTGAEAAIAELSLCGTLNGTNVTYMVNHTIKEWINRIEMRGMDKNFRINITLKELKVVPIDAWDFAIIVDTDVDAVDDAGICYYRGISQKTMANTSIIGLEDPFYTLETGGAIIKYVYDCESLLNITQVIGNGTSGAGLGTGAALIYSSSLGSVSKIEDYCNNNSADELNGTVLLLDAGGTLACSQTIKDCINASYSKHFAGLVSKGANNLGCAASIPWISNATDFSVSGGNCLFLRNSGALYDVVLGTACRDVNYSCYKVSNITGNEPGCSENYSQGPSFFDRLDGSTNLSAKYRNQSIKNFNNPDIGIETLVDFYDLLDHNIIPYENATWVDYLYWQQINGSDVCGVCATDVPAMKLDCRHARKYNITTGC